MKSLWIDCVGYKVAADWYEGTNNEVLLVLIGHSSSKASYQDLVSTIVKQTGTSALVLDYSGHGESPFNLSDLTPAQNFMESITAFDWLKTKYPKKIVNVLGTSYGGFLAVQLTKYRQFNKLVLRVPAIYRPEDFYTKWEDLSKNFIHVEYGNNSETLAGHPLLKRVARFKGKVLVMVHEQDEVVHKATTDAYIKVFNADTYLAKGFGHSFSAHLEERDKIEAYQKALADWSNKN